MTELGGFTTVVSTGASDFVFVVRTIFGVRGLKTRRRTVSIKKRPLTTPRSEPHGRFHVFLYRIRVARTQKLAIKRKVQIYFREFAKTVVVFKCRFVYEGFARKNERWG